MTSTDNLASATERRSHFKAKAKTLLAKSKHHAAVADSLREQAMRTDTLAAELLSSAIEAQGMVRQLDDQIAFEQAEEVPA